MSRGQGEEREAKFPIIAFSSFPDPLGLFFFALSLLFFYSRAPIPSPRAALSRVLSSRSPHLDGLGDGLRGLGGGGGRSERGAGGGADSESHCCGLESEKNKERRWRS